MSAAAKMLGYEMIPRHGQEDSEKSVDLELEEACMQHSSPSPSRSLIRIVLGVSIASLLVSLAVNAILIPLQLPSLLRRPLGKETAAFDRSVVGVRALSPRYQGCSSSELLQSMARIVLDPETQSKLRSSNLTYEPQDLEFSFQLPGPCPQPHVYTQEEACDLLERGFGGLFMRGDSLMRHFVNAMFIILRGSRSGAVEDPEASKVCWGDRMFDDRESCRVLGIGNSQTTTVPVCNGQVYLAFEHGTVPGDPAGFVPRFQSWLATMHPFKNALSPVVMQGFGLHGKMRPSISSVGAVQPMLAYARTAFPKPVLLWHHIHAPGPNKPVQYLAEQGREPVKVYNAAMEKEIARLVRPEAPMAIFDTFGLTDGAYTFDGTHYAYQANMEKAQMLLNYLDLVWTEARDAGSLWDHSDVF